MRFDVLQSLSLCGDPLTPNDDRAGAGDALAWVIDGATDLGEPGLVGTRGGAAWIAQEANAALAAAGDAGLEAVCKGLFARIARRFEAVRTRAPLGDWELPSASFLAARASEGRVDFAWAGDCTALVKRGDVVERVGPLAQGKADEAAHAASLTEHGLGLKSRPAPIIASLRATRAQPGRRVLSVDLAGVAGLGTGTVPCGYGDELLLMTDGFAALIDQFDAIDAATLMAALHREGLAGIGHRLRAIEAEDADCVRYPRFKTSDDATALWLRCAA
ncbi:protein phosphatase 2C domain-containing protein [Sphingomonas sp.]|uniref:protein phosphatase 2C domain-containing protein n=1 Tax=Sphingomonas sp. TaxID=28214 RepID=UPI001DB42685|nr:protein phosphatase 2C domain-containing protein [Sphingomonas sp.]MBX9796582.1 protein phosphatase 2C domain-containing protein [Sphingomonas sp.]